MRPLLLGLSAMALSAMLTAPAAAGGTDPLRDGGPAVVHTSGVHVLGRKLAPADVRPSHTSPGRAHWRGRRDHDDRWIWRDRRDHWRRGDRRDRLSGYYRVFDDDDGYIHRAAPRPELPPAPPVAPSVAEVPAEPAAPPDPRGPLRLSVARGAERTAAFTVGEPLPENLPHVTLDWRLYDLPEPPEGLIYVRVGREVLLITPVDRVVERVVEPG